MAVGGGMIRSMLDGAGAMAFLAIATFFLRFWQRTRDRLFAYFAVAFVLLTVSRVMLAPLASYTESETPIYVTRLLAFMMIILGIWHKNRHPGAPG